MRGLCAIPCIPDSLGKNLLKYRPSFLERSMLLTVNISSSLAFRRASRRCRTTRNAIVRWSYTRCDNTRCASQQYAVGLSSAEACPSSQNAALFSAIIGALSPKSAVLFSANEFQFSAICVLALRYTLYGSPQFAFCLLRTTCSGSTQYFPVLRNKRSTSPQYAFCLSAISCPLLRNTSSYSPLWRIFFPG
jgi:hypothetical protein